MWEGKGRENRGVKRRGRDSDKGGEEVGRE